MPMMANLDITDARKPGNEARDWLADLAHFVCNNKRNG